MSASLAEVLNNLSDLSAPAACASQVYPATVAVYLTDLDLDFFMSVCVCFERFVLATVFFCFFVWGFALIFPQNLLNGVTSPSHTTLSLFSGICPPSFWPLSFTVFTYVCIYIYAVGSISWPHFGHFKVNNLSTSRSITWPLFWTYKNRFFGFFQCTIFRGWCKIIGLKSCIWSKKCFFPKKGCAFFLG